jgi:hypothetical protein
MRRFAPSLQPEPFDVDLNATKPPAALHEAFVLTTRPVERAIASFALERMPPELNVAQPAAGGPIALARREDLRWGALAAVEARQRLHAYHWRRNRTSRRRTLAFWAARFIDSLPFGGGRRR